MEARSVASGRLSPTTAGVPTGGPGAPTTSRSSYTTVEITDFEACGLRPTHAPLPIGFEGDAPDTVTTIFRVDNPTQFNTLVYKQGEPALGSGFGFLDGRSAEQQAPIVEGDFIFVTRTTSGELQFRTIDPTVTVQADERTDLHVNAIDSALGAIPGVIAIAVRP